MAGVAQREPKHMRDIRNLPPLAERFIWWGEGSAVSLRYIAEFAVVGGDDVPEEWTDDPSADGAVKIHDAFRMWELRAYRADLPAEVNIHTLGTFLTRALATAALEKLLVGLHEDGHAETFIFLAGEHPREGVES